MVTFGYAVASVGVYARLNRPPNAIADGKVCGARAAGSGQLGSCALMHSYENAPLPSVPAFDSSGAVLHAPRASATNTHRARPTAAWQRRVENAGKAWLTSDPLEHAHLDRATRALLRVAQVPGRPRHGPTLPSIRPRDRRDYRLLDGLLRGHVYSAPLDGGALDAAGATTLASNQIEPTSIHVDSNNLYWIDSCGPGSSVRAQLDGGQL